MEPIGIRWLAVGLIATGISIFANELMKINAEQDAQRIAGK